MSERLRKNGSRRRRLLLASAWPPAVGGAATFTERLASNEEILRHFEIIAHQTIKRPSLAFREDWGMLKSRWVPLLKGLSTTKNIVRYVALLARHRPEVVQIHYNSPFAGPRFWEAAFYLVVARAIGAVTVVRHGGLDHFQDSGNTQLRQFLIRNAYCRWISGLVLQWEGLRESYADWIRTAGLTTKTITIPNTVDVDAFRCTTPRGATEQDNRLLTIGCIAGPEGRRKGAYDLLQVVAQMKRRSGKPEFKLSALAAEPEFIRAVDERDVGSIVECKPVLTGDDKRRWYSQLDIFALPTYREGFPNSLLEAMAAGCAIVTTPVDAISSVVYDEQSALIIEPGDTDALEKALVRLLGDDTLRRALGEGALARASGHYDVRSNWLRPLLDLLDELPVIHRSA